MAAPDPPHDRNDPAWDHIDPDHPEPWKGCIRRGLCCMSNPGWFAPGEAEKAAEVMGMEMADFVNAFLVVDHAKTTIGVIEGFVPAKMGPGGDHVETPGTKTGPSYKFTQGRCVFYTGTGCLIYEARPFECTRYACTNMPEDNPSRLELAMLWLQAHDATVEASQDSAD